MDFLKRFVSDDGGAHMVKKEKVDHEEENIELSLGLSLNGKYGIEKRRMDNNNNMLIRASSVVTDMTSFLTDDQTTSSLTRTCSLPVEMMEDDEFRRKKEMQSLRRFEAKRKRVEKMKNGTNCEVKKKRCLVNGNNQVTKSFLPPLPRMPSVGSPGSGGSSGVSDLESLPFSGINKDTDSKSTSQQSVSQQISNSNLYRSNSVASKPVPEKFTITSSQNVDRNRSKDETLKMMLSDMPCVSTKGDGINGNKIEGFLYRYRKGEEVRIVCVCHGSFLTPAEFVKHGGGGDVEHPLRHIVVNPPSL
ncbi:ninja-family protein AFP3-like protein [Tanacetum coccineum]